MTDRSDPGARARAWAERGRLIEAAGHRVFVVDLEPSGPVRHPPLLVVHGFPTSSFDFRHVVDALGAERRVVLLDLVGFGRSAVPDMAYSMGLQADVVGALTEQLDLRRLALLTHDMGDTVGGELLARQLEGRWDVEVVARVLTNGSIYIEMAHLRPGQELLLTLPDAALDQGPDGATLAGSLAETMAEHSESARAEVDQDAAVVAGEPARMLPRTIRYLEERRRHQDRFTGAIERHPSPLGVVWGDQDPIAVPEMVDRLSSARPGTPVRWLRGVGHYPMLEAPQDFAAAVGDLLGDLGG